MFSQWNYTTKKCWFQFANNTSHTNRMSSIIPWVSENMKQRLKYNILMIPMDSLRFRQLAFLTCIRYGTGPVVMWLRNDGSWVRNRDNVLSSSFLPRLPSSFIHFPRHSNRRTRSQLGLMVLDRVLGIFNNYILHHFIDIYIRLVP